MESLNKELECGICLEVCVDAVEARCCSQLFCEKCVELVKDGLPWHTVCCPMCRKVPFVTATSRVSRRVISKLPLKCPHCHANVERGVYEVHLRECPELVYCCSVEGCSYEGRKEEFLEHLLPSHERNLLTIFTTKGETQKDCGSGKQTQGELDLLWTLLICVITAINFHLLICYALSVPICVLYGRMSNFVHKQPSAGQQKYGTVKKEVLMKLIPVVFAICAINLPYVVLLVMIIIRYRKYLPFKRHIEDLFALSMEKFL